MDDRLAGAPARLSAAAIAAAAWAGIWFHVDAQWTATGSLLEALWIIGRYFTVLTNVIVAVLFTLLALGWSGARRPRLIAGVTLSIALVGVVYGLLLQGLLELSAGAAVADVMLHKLTPLMVPLFWLFYVPKGTLQWRDPALWTIYPVAYLVYALARGGADGKYAYPFIDIVKNGVPQVALTCALIAIGFVAVGLALVWLDRALARRAAPGI